MVYGAMLAKSCCRSHGQPVPGVRSAAMISIRRPMSREGFSGGDATRNSGPREAGPGLTYCIAVSGRAGGAIRIRDIMEHGAWVTSHLRCCFSIVSQAYAQTSRIPLSTLGQFN